MRTVRAVPLTAETFAPFGQVVSSGLAGGVAANQGTATRIDHAARLENTRSGARPNLAVFRSAAKGLPFEIRLLERHPASSQLFVPMRCERFLVAVAPSDADGEPLLGELHAFVCRPGQAVNYAPGCWHHPIVALDGPAEFTMLAWEDGTAADCEERPLNESILVTD